ESGNVLKELEKRVDELSKIEVKATSDVKHANESLNAEKKKLRQLQKNNTDSTSQLQSKEKLIEKLEHQISSFEERNTADAQAVTKAQDHYHAVSAGLSSNDDGEDKTLADQLMECKNAISKADTEIKQAQIKLKHEEGELKKKQADLKSTEKGYEKDKVAFEAMKKDLTKIENQLKTLNYRDGQEDELIARKRKLSQEVSRLQNIVETLEARFPQLQFEYHDPEPRFDRRKVKGLVANLINIKDVKYATALQVTAGGRIYNVVVDTDRTGKQLLQNGRLQRKVTLIPLNKIAARSISDTVVQSAKSCVGAANVDTALSLVGYDKEIEGAMKFVFGSSFVAADLNSAKKVAFDPNVKTRTVTLDGDVFDPSGTLSGGARRQQQSILASIQELQDARTELSNKEKELRNVEKELEGIKSVAERYNKLSTDLDMKTREIELVEDRLKQSTHHQKVEELDAYKASVEQQKTTIQQGKETMAAATKKSKDLDQKMKEKSAHREKELKSAETALTKAKQKAETSKKEFKTKQQELEEASLEIEALRAELNGLEEQLTAAEETITKMSEECERLSDVANEKKTETKEAEQALAQQKETLRLCSEKINEKSKEKNAFVKETSSNQLKLKEMEHKILKVNKDAQDAAQKVEYMLEKYDWIANEKQYFGQENTAYDFQANDPKDAAKQLTRLNETKEKLGKSVNMRAMNMLGKAEEKYNDLMKKKKIVENDKKKIEEVIKDLDQKKNEALKIASAKVNKDFGSIFSTLLPGSDAKLAPPEGMTVLDGLEVKVAFGSVWKESLTELSGGQRSLVALSLILSMLLFKPAPIYILDEVDAALDLSHTQNIGQMLRQHFRHSQFIVVSLKDGMFNNANVLFKTKFVDGVSTVNRFVQNSSTRDTLKKR
uniref:SMC hinge domain-containing protein n=2 Tax=Clytia hemisphaerica TaxID=252671 RepID=A0A7M5XBT0_9CNID